MEERVVHIRGGDKMAGRLDQRTVLAEGLAEAGKQRHVLTGGPDGPIFDQEQRFGIGLDKGEEKTPQGHLGAKSAGYGTSTMWKGSAPMSGRIQPGSSEERDAHRTMTATLPA